MMVLVAALLAQAAPIGSAAWTERHHPPLPKLAACDLGRRTRPIASLAQLPDPVAAELGRAFRSAGGITGVDGEYNASDVIDDPGVRRHRFLRAYHVGGTWMIWFESGGIVRTLSTLAIDAHTDPRTGAIRYEVAAGSRFGVPLCAGTRAYLAGARTLG